MRYAMSNFSQSNFSKLIISMQFSLLFLAVQYTVEVIDQKSYGSQ